jgi:UDP-glucose 4-epimerase
MKTLVVGGRGFIGRYTARAFATAGFEVSGIGHGAWPSHNEWGVANWTDVHVSVASLLNRADQIDVIVNCAGSGNVGYSFQNPLEDFDKNVRTTVEILEFVRLYSPKTIVLSISSAGVYGQSHTIPTPETATPRPVAPYGVNKWVSEELCRSYVSHFGLSVAVIRPFSVYGPGLRKQLLWDACRKLSAGKCLFFGTGKETRDWIHVTDVSRLLLTLATCNFGGFQILNAGTGRKTSNERILELLAHNLGVSDQISFAGQIRRGDPEHYCADVSTSLALGWLAEMKVEDGIAEYARWYQNDISNWG